MNASSFIGYGIIGTSDGFVAQTAGVISNVDIGAIVDLDNRQLFAPFNTEIIAGIRQKKDDHLYTYFVLYRYAVEKERSRKGSFYGSVVALKDCTADGFAIYNLLLELATNVKVYLDPESRRFLVPMEEISFLRPDCLEEVIRSIKKSKAKHYQNSAYFAPLPDHSRNTFRFIDFFQSDPNAVEKVFISSDSEVEELVKNKGGIQIKPIQLENALVEQKLERIENIDSEVMTREKELENIHHKLQEIQAHQKKLALDKDQLADKVGQLEKLVESKQIKLEEYDQLKNKKVELESLIQSLSLQKQTLELEIHYLQQESQKIKIRKTASPKQEHQRQKEPSYIKEKTSSSAMVGMQNFMNNLHPMVRLAVLIFMFLSLGTIGYLTTTAFGKNKVALNKEAPITIPSKELLRLEQQINQEYQAFNKQAQDSYLARLVPFLNDVDTIVQEKAKQIQNRILSIGYEYYSTEIKRTDTIPVLHNQLIEEFEVLKRNYDSVFVKR